MRAIWKPFIHFVFSHQTSFLLFSLRLWRMSGGPREQMHAVLSQLHRRLPLLLSPWLPLGCGQTHLHWYEQSHWCLRDGDREQNWDMSETEEVQEAEGSKRGRGVQDGEARADSDWGKVNCVILNHIVDFKEILSFFICPQWAVMRICRGRREAIFPVPPGRLRTRRTPPVSTLCLWIPTCSSSSTSLTILMWNKALMVRA